MNENYPSDVKLDENPDGTVSFATDVVATIAGLAATEVEGVSSMSSPSSGLADMFSRRSTRNFTKGVRVDLIERHKAPLMEHRPVAEDARGVWPSSVSSAGSRISPQSADRPARPSALASAMRSSIRRP